MVHGSLTKPLHALARGALVALAILPGSEPAVAVEKGWAFQPVGVFEPPAVRDNSWPYNDIDRFLLARMEGRGVAPNAQKADPLTLLRRVAFDLTGLPPSEIGSMESVASGFASGEYEALIDRLLDSPRFGERWGRHWLDVVRYADATGGGRAMLLPNAWRYRDYVIESLQRDVPYDQFVREQIAGDLLATDVSSERRRRLIATGFLALGPTNYELQDKEKLRMDVVDEQLDTMGRAFMGLTIGCARCHDHFFDPITARDYYALAGILRSTKSMNHSNVSQWIDNPLPALTSEEAQSEVDAARLASELDAAMKNLADARTSEEKSSLNAQIARIKKSQDKADREKPRAMGVMDEKDPGDFKICAGGDVHKPGDPVPRGFIAAAMRNHGEARPPIPANESGRLQLAEWIASPHHPTTARVMVNRIWLHLFGQGLVGTPDNFGNTGDEPSHPELLDWLARRFVEKGWSVKSLIREIMLSHAYQMSGDHEDSDPRAKIDPDNRLLWRANTRRLEAEAVRDSILAASGRLVHEGGGPSIRQGTSSEFGYRFDSTRRSVYLPVFRNQLPDIFEVFDFASPNIVTGKRPVTTLSTQALFLMNSPFIAEESKHTARRLLHSGDAEAEDEERLMQRATLLILGRAPSNEESALGKEFLLSFPGSREEAWTAFVQSLFCSIDFRYLR